MSIGKARGVEREPTVELIRWKVMLTGHGTHHFIGVHSRRLSGRVSSAIVDFDRPGLMGHTRSGRAYLLVGASMHDTDADYVWQCWCALNRVTSYEDISCLWARVDSTGHE